MKEIWDLTLTSGDTLNLNGSSYVYDPYGAGSSSDYRLWPLIQGADDAASDDPPADADEGDNNSDDTDDESSGGEDDKGEDKKFTQKDLDRILAKEKSKALRGKVDAKELGFESKKDLDEFIAAQKKKAEDDKSEAEKAQEAAITEATKNAREEAMGKAKSMTLKAEFKVAASEAGIPKERLDDAYSLAQNLENWGEDVAIDDEGTVTGLDEDFFKGLQESKPWLFPTDDDDDESGGSGNIGAGAGGKGKLTDEEKLRKQYSALQGFTGN